MEIPEEVYQRIVTNADRVDGHLISRYSVGSHGYAQIGWTAKGKRTVTIAHRALWIYLHGPIPEGMTVDHNCPGRKERKCVEDSHLRLIPNFENARRTRGRDWPLGECVNGHSNEFLIRVNGDRKWACSICKKEWNSRYYQKKKKA